ncbi:hypothetical protein [Enterococcus mundtii]|uniref:hypothetical protein n=1 Tax=Enterococcus mundtii TaxID=53346 RepID=UPI000BB55416|nr:hypothetical protein [Enterococcus mundtii]
MMKNYYQKFFQFVQWQFILNFILGLCYMILSLVRNMFTDYSLPFLQDLAIVCYDFLTMLMNGCFYLLLLMLLLLMLTLSIEIVSRLKNDSLKNLFRSISLTFHIRRRLLREADHDKESSAKINAFNYATKRSIADIRNNSFVWKVPVPADSQATELLKKSFPEIQEEIAHFNPEFSYSNFERNNRFFYIKGTKKSETLAPLGSQKGSEKKIKF